MKENRADDNTGNYSECSLWVEFYVELTDQEDRLPMAALDLPARVVRQHVETDRCIVHLEETDDSGCPSVAQLSVECDRKCVCNVMTDSGHIPHLEEYREDGILIGTHLSAREDLDALVEGLGDISDRVSLRRLSKRGPDCDADPVTVDLSALTEKQQEAAVLAVSKGYYQTPRRTSVDRIADELGITKSAVSQRLSAVESKLATAVFDDRAEA